MPSPHGANRATVSPPDRTVTDTKVSPALIQAYEQTDYRVLVQPPFTMKIGKPSRELADLYRRTRTSTACVITAWNPRSKKQCDDDNDAAQARLTADLDMAGLRHLPALGADPTETWKGEASLLVLDASRKTAEDLGRKYGQNCIVWAEADAVPRLVFLR
jgi:hypothetical protein